MTDWFFWMKGWPPELVTLFVAMIPIAEIRVSIPFALEVLDISMPRAIFFSVLGDMIPAVLIILSIERIVRWVCRVSPKTERCYVWFAGRTKIKFAKGYAKYGAAIALAVFVGIPLPMTGSWSGALAAFLFGIPKRVALPAIFIGVCIAATIVTLIDLGIVKFFF